MVFSNVDLTGSMRRSESVAEYSRPSSMYSKSTGKPIPRNGFLQRVEQVASDNNLEFSNEYEVCMNSEQLSVTALAVQRAGCTTV